MGGATSGPSARDARPQVLVVHPGAELYGSDRMAAEAVAGLVAAGCAVVVALPVDGPLTGRLEELGATVVRIPVAVLRKSALTPGGAVRLAADAVRSVVPSLRLARAHGRDGVYVSTLTLPLWPLLGRLARRRVTVHVHEAEDSLPGLVRTAMALPAVLAQRVLVNSLFARDVLTRSLARVGRRAEVVLNGVAGPPVTTAPREHLDGPLRVLYVGRLSHRKGPQVAVDVLAELLRRGRDARLQVAGAVFAGNEAFERQLRDQVETLGLGGRVELLGFVDDVWSVLAGNDVVLVPSVLEETFGNTVVEALLAARPVVVSDSSGLREAAVDHRTALLAPPGDVPAWADAVQQLADRWPQVRADVQDDARRAATRHDTRVYAARVARLILAGSTGGPFRGSSRRPIRRRA